MKMLYGLEHDDLLFEFNSNHTLNGILDRSAAKAGVKRIRVHDLRHSHASLCIEAGISVLLLSERLGHENIETTLNTYSHLYPNKQAALASDLDMLAKGEKSLKKNS
jgi:integrase